MCLDYKFSDENRNKILDLTPGDDMTVYKIVGVVRKKYHPIVAETRTPYLVGEMDADGTTLLESKHDPDFKYQAGFHFFTSMEVAEGALERLNEDIQNEEYMKKTMPKFRKNNELFRKTFTIIKCIIKKSWITTMGFQRLHCPSHPVIVCNKAIFPDPAL